MEKYSREENEIWLLRYLDERCEGAGTDFAVPIAYVWWEEGPGDHPDGKLLVERMDRQGMEAAFSRLLERELVDCHAAGNGYSAWITEAGRQFVRDTEYPDIYTDHIESAKRHPVKARIMLFHKMFSPFAGYVAIVIALISFIRGCMDQ